MTHYYGVMVSELTGDVDDLEVDSKEEKPTTEWAGRFTFAKWFNTAEKRDKVKAYLKKAIEEHQRLHS